MDEPLVWYYDPATNSRRYLLSDNQGSVIAQRGTSLIAFSYGPYGEPNSWNATRSRFRYTGQIALFDAQLYYYKARVYDPLLGRFLQTDPVGYEADNNLYACVGNDPLNPGDLSGMPPPEGSIAEQQMFRGARDTAAQCGNACAVAGAVLGAVIASAFAIAT